MLWRVRGIALLIGATVHYAGIAGGAVFASGLGFGGDWFRRLRYMLTGVALCPYLVRWRHYRSATMFYAGRQVTEGGTSAQIHDVVKDAGS